MDQQIEQIVETTTREFDPTQKIVLSWWDSQHNPFLAEWAEYMNPMLPTNEYYWTHYDYQKRDDFRERYSYAIPCEGALRTIETHSPSGLVELGAGNGYWTHLLRLRGLEIRAYDRAPFGSNPYGFVTRWADFERGDENVLAMLPPELTLFICWPSYDQRWAHHALRVYRGHTLIYIGESQGGCTADDLFFQTLHGEWKEIGAFQIPYWPCANDQLWVYAR